MFPFPYFSIHLSFHIEHYNFILFIWGTHRAMSVISLTLRSSITSDGTWETIWDVRDRIKLATTKVSILSAILLL